MLEHFTRFIRGRKLCRMSDKILVAVSGGVDSVALLDLLLKAGYSVGVVHCNFGLRGEESDEEARFVETLAAKASVPFFVRRFETASYASDRGMSVQMAARELRYNWFEELRREKKYTVVATGHNLNDSIETILFNFAKGTGLKGLTGIPVRSGRIIRPLLFASRKDIEDFALRNGLRFRTDSSNRSTKYRRNLIRHKVMPILENINPGFLGTAGSTIGRLESSQRFLERWLKSKESAFSETRGSDIFLEKAFFLEVDEPVVLHEVIRPFGFNYDQSQAIFKSLRRGSGLIFCTKNFILNVDRTQLIISPAKDRETQYKIRKNDEMILTSRFRLDMECMPVRKEKISKHPHVAYLDKDKLKFPLELRNWVKGDWFVPFGMQGKKKLSDFMIDKKIPLNLKKRIMVLLSGGSIAWVVGHRSDDRFKVDDSTREILKITYQELDDQSV